MADQTTQRMVVHASPERVWELLTDFRSYPVWATALKSATIVSSDDQGRGVEVAFRAAAMGRSTSYTLCYDYSEAPRVLSWKLSQGDITRVLDGSYELVPVAQERTEIVYDLTVDLTAPLPGFVKRRAEERIIHTALTELRDYLDES
jgi:ribosome-associated toxin RatA of RatAB toxin-antitoxin module